MKHVTNEKFARGIAGIMTGRELLTMFARMRGIPEQHIPDTVAEAITNLNLDVHADKLCGSYSGGNLAYFLISRERERERERETERERERERESESARSGVMQCDEYRNEYIILSKIVIVYDKDKTLFKNLMKARVTRVLSTYVARQQEEVVHSYSACWKPRSSISGRTYGRNGSYSSSFLMERAI